MTNLKLLNRAKHNLNFIDNTQYCFSVLVSESSLLPSACDESLHQRPWPVSPVSVQAIRLWTDTLSTDVFSLDGQESKCSKLYFRSVMCSAMSLLEGKVHLFRVTIENIKHESPESSWNFLNPRQAVKPPMPSSSSSVVDNISPWRAFISLSFLKISTEYASLPSYSSRWKALTRSLMLFRGETLTGSSFNSNGLSKALRTWDTNPDLYPRHAFCPCHFFSCFILEPTTGKKICCFNRSQKWDSSWHIIYISHITPFISLANRVHVF